MSYARADESLVTPVKAALEKAGLTAWHDQSEIKGGDIWEAVIRRSLTQSDALLVFVTKNLLGSYVETELSLAEDLRKPIIPLVFDQAFDEASAVIERLRRYQSIDFRKSRAAAISNTVAAVHRSHLAPVLSTFNVKGGVGKTTVTMHLAAYLFKQAKKRVLIIDNDPQTNLSTAMVLPVLTKNKSSVFSQPKVTRTDVLGPLQATKKSVLGVLEDSILRADNIDHGFELENYIHRLDKGDGGSVLDIVVGDPHTRRLATSATQPMAKRASNGFSRFIGQCRKEYDIIFIDMNPSISTLSMCSLAAATHILSPVKPDSFSMQGLNLLDDISHESGPGDIGREQIILINDPREDREGVVRATIRDSKFKDNLIEHDLVYSKYFVAAPGGRVNASLSNLPAYGKWSESPRSERKALKDVAEAIAERIGVHL